MGSNRFRIDMPRYIDLYMQGRLKLESQPGTGTALQVWLPDVGEAA